MVIMKMVAYKMYFMRILELVRQLGMFVPTRGMFLIQIGHGVGLIITVQGGNINKCENIL